MLSSSHISLSLLWLFLRQLVADAEQPREGVGVALGERKGQPMHFVHMITDDGYSILILIDYIIPLAVFLPVFRVLP